METRSAKRKKLMEAAAVKAADEVDRISDLPDDVIHRGIFALLPIKTIARMSVVSKRWRDLWHSYPDLDFTSVDSLNVVVNAAKCHRARAAEYADQIIGIIERHSSDLRTLKIRASLNCSQLVRLIRHAVKHDVVHLVLDVRTCNGYFNFPRSLLQCDSLQSLRLRSRSMGFRLPASTRMREGFRSLKSLSLSGVNSEDDPSQMNLFTGSSFPCLKNLHLEHFMGLQHLGVHFIGVPLQDLSIGGCNQLEELEIAADRLQRLTISNSFNANYSNSIKRKVKIRAPALKFIKWWSSPIPSECAMDSLTCLEEAFVGSFHLDYVLSAVKPANLSAFLTRICHCRSLTLGYYSLEVVCNSSLGICAFQKLKCLELTTALCAYNNRKLLSLFRSCPILQTLAINLYSEMNTEIRGWNKEVLASILELYWKSKMEASEPLLRHLKVVKIEGFTERPNDVGLVLFLLRHVQALEEMHIGRGLCQPKDFPRRAKLKKLLLAFCKASSKATIRFDF